MAGQNLGIYGSSPNQPTVREAIQKAISGFFNEYNDTSMDDIRSFRSAYSTKWVILIWLVNSDHKY